MKRCDEVLAAIDEAEVVADCFSSVYVSEASLHSLRMLFPITFLLCITRRSTAFRGRTTRCNEKFSYRSRDATILYGSLSLQRVAIHVQTKGLFIILRDGSDWWTGQITCTDSCWVMAQQKSISMVCLPTNRSRRSSHKV